jgi:hypothetical protein
MRVQSILLLSFLTTMLCGACDSKGMTAEDASSDDTATIDESDDHSDDTANGDTAIFVEPVWWRLSAGLTLRDGVPVTEESSLTLELLGGEDEQLCLQELTLQSVEALKPEHESILAWWRVTPTAVETLCGIYDTPLLESLRIGVGQMHPDILAAIEAIPTIDADAPLNAAFAALSDDSQIYVYGVAGTVEAYEGGGEVATKAPLDDGLWSIKPVYRFTY